MMPFSVRDSQFRFYFKKLYVTLYTRFLFLTTFIVSTEGRHDNIMTSFVAYAIDWGAVEVWLKALQDG
jgi:hypothetical protein